MHSAQEGGVAYGHAIGELPPPPPKVKFLDQILAWFVELVAKISITNCTGFYKYITTKSGKPCNLIYS